MTNLTIKSLQGSIAIVSYGDDYYDKEIPIPDEFISGGSLNISAFLLYATGFTPDKKQITIAKTKTIFVGSNPKQRVVDILNTIGEFEIITNPNIWADNIAYDWDQNEEMIRYVEHHNMLYKMTRYLMHNKWVTNEVARLINLDFTMTMSRNDMATPFPKIVYPKNINDIDNFFSALQTVIVKPFYGLQDDSREFDRKVYNSKEEFINDIVTHYGSLDEFFKAQTQKDFVWTNENKHSTPIMLQEYFNGSDLITTASYRIVPSPFLNHLYVDPLLDEVTKTAIDNFLRRSGTLKQDLLTIKCIKDQNNFAYILDVSFAVNNYLDLSDDILTNIFKHAYINLPSS